MKPHCLVLLFGLLLIITLMACRNSTSNFTTNTVINLDTSEVVQLRKENKELRNSNYWLKRKRYQVKTDTIHVRDTIYRDIVKHDTPESKPYAFFHFNPDSYPPYFEYNARTDNWPPASTNPKVLAAQKADRESWDSLWQQSKDYRREIDETLFKR